jgi:ribosome-associated protein
VTSSLRISAQVVIPSQELRFSFVRSSGPGGQNVNKVASKAVLRWQVAGSASIPEPVRQRFIDKFRRRINERGEIIISSQRYRDQAKNVTDCLAKLRELILLAMVVPKLRKKSSVPKAAKETRLRQKRIASEKKQRRKTPTPE